MTVIAYVLFIIWALNPFFTWNSYLGGVIGTIAGIPVRSIFALIAILSGIIVIKRKHKTNNNYKKPFLFFLFVCFVLLVICGGNNNSPFDTAWVSFVACAVYLLLPNETQINILEKFTLIFTVTLIPGIIFFVIANVLRINLPYSILLPPDSAKAAAGIFYKHMPLYSQIVSPLTVFPRFSGIYYEAGVVGTICALLLGTRDFKIIGKENWIGMILFVGGICSLTLSFVLLTLIYFVVSNIAKGKMKNAVVLILIIAAYFLLINIQISNPIIASIQTRLKIVDYSIQGDNRASIVYNRVYEELFNESGLTIAIGKGRDAFAQALSYYPTADGSSYKNIIYDYGILGFVLYISWYIYTMFHVKNKSKNKNTILGGILLMQLANIYQKPDVFAIYYFVIFVGGLSLKFVTENNA